MEENKNTYQVIITNQLDDNQDKNLIITRLAAVFKVDETKAAQLLAKPRSIVKDDTDEITAKKYLAAIQKTGAHCEIINKTDDEELPGIIEPVKPEPAQFVRHTEHSEAPKKVRDVELAMVEREHKQEKDTREKLSSLQNFQKEAFCPECGTIRSDEDATCLHCGYDPKLRKKSSGNFKKLAYAFIAIAALIAIIIFAGLPYYQQHVLKGKIENGLQLAFDTRNQVTEFIERTSFWPNQNIDANLPKNISNDVIESIIISDNTVMTITLRAEAINNMHGQTIIFVPNSLKGKLVWNCTGGTAENGLRPDICKKPTE